MSQTPTGRNRCEAPALPGWSSGQRVSPKFEKKGLASSMGTHHMSLKLWIIGAVAALLVLLEGVVFLPYALRGRALPGVRVGDIYVSGLTASDLQKVLSEYDRALQDKTIRIQVKNKEQALSLRSLGMHIDTKATARRAIEAPLYQVLGQAGYITPVMRSDPTATNTAFATSFGDVVTLPRNASLVLTAGTAVTPIKGQRGQGIETKAFEQAVANTITSNTWAAPLTPVLQETEPAVTDAEITSASQLATKLLREGLTLSFEGQQWLMRPATVRRLLRFEPQRDSQNRENFVLGITLDPVGLEEYLRTTIAPDIDRPAVSARFGLSEGSVVRLSEAVRGQALRITESVTLTNAALRRRETSVALTVAVTEADITSEAEVAAWGPLTRLALGESNFVGSPRNRVHNITVGAQRYHGLLIPPRAEFSFNEFLGPVTAAAGFKPELVIKHNQTIPEFGGGLCQVSTTVFRGALNAGLPITERRNHAYIVRYYGTPGFDATIYPPSTDLKFRNDTPGFLLLQVRIEGTHLAVELWGTSDGRQVEIVGPSVYNRQPDGSARATLTQKITRDGATNEQVFYSRYRSPNLFPKTVVDTGAPAPVAP